MLQIEQFLRGTVDEIIREYGGNETQTYWKLLDSVQTSVRGWFTSASVNILTDNQL